MAKELTTKIILKGMTDPSLTKAFQNANKLSNSSLKHLNKVGETAKKVAKVGATAVVAGLGYSAKAAIDYESAFAGVMKTVEETGTTTYDDLSKSIRNMAKEMPATANEIAAVAETAGQLGIKADDIAKFSKVMIDLGETTNLTSEDAASSIAKFFNVTKTGMGDVDKFGSTLVALGNNAATTEADILAMATRIASSGSMIGLSNQEILALATSLSSVGLEAEGGGTAISTVLSQIDKEVATGGETLKTWASLAGMSASGFKTAWQNDTMGTIQKVVSGMGDAKAGGQNLNIILDELGIKGIRTSDTMKRLSNASGLMADMTNLANTSWEENSALTKEAQTRYNTMASKIQILRNKLNDVAITVGNKLMPVMDSIMNKMDKVDWDAVGEKIANSVQWVIDNFGWLKYAILAVGATIGAVKVGGLLSDINKLTKGVGDFIKVAGDGKGIKLFSNGLSGLGTNVANLASGLKTSLLTSLKSVGTAIAGIGAPALIVIAVVALLAGAFVTLWKNNEDFKNSVLGIWTEIKEKFQTFSSGIVERINELGFNFESITDVIKAVWNGFCNFIAAPILLFAFKRITNFISSALDIITGVVDVFVGLFTGDWEQCWTGIKEICMGVWNWLTSNFRAIWSVIDKYCGDAIKSAVNWFKQLPSKIWTWVTNTAQKISTWATNLRTKSKEAGSNFVNGIVNWFKQLPTKISEWVTRMATIAQIKLQIFIARVKAFFSKLPYIIGYLLGFVIGKIIAFGQKLWNFATVTIPQFIGKVIEWFKQLPGRIWTWLVNTWNKFVTWRNQMYAKAWEIGKSVITAIVNFFKTLPSKVWTWLTNTISKIIAWGSRMISLGKQKAVQFVTSVISFIKQLPSKIWTWLTNTAQKVVSWGTNLATKGKAAALKLYNSIVNKIKELPTKLKEIGKNAVQGIWNGIKNAKDWLLDKIKSFASGITDGIKDALGIKSPSTVMRDMVGKFIPSGIAVGIQRYAGTAISAVKSMGGKIANTASKISPTIQTKIATVKDKIKKFGKGGTVTTPQHAIVGDKPETIVPHGNTPRNRSLLLEAAKGVGKKVGGAIYNITFAPVINGGNAKENKQMLEEEYIKFKQMMDEYIKEKGELAY